MSPPGRSAGPVRATAIAIAAQATSASRSPRMWLSRRMRWKRCPVRDAWTDLAGRSAPWTMAAPPAGVRCARGECRKSGPTMAAGGRPRGRLRGGRLLWWYSGRLILACFLGACPSGGRGVNVRGGRRNVRGPRPWWCLSALHIAGAPARTRVPTRARRSVRAGPRVGGTGERTCREVCRHACP
jgi:hypothetical protein